MAYAAVQRRLTAAFVKVAPVKIALSGIESITSASGGVTRTKMRARPPVVGTLVEPSDSGYRSPVADERGTRQAYDFLLVAEWGTDVREGDEFDQGGHHYRVDTRMIDNGYEVRALVIRVA